jgi:hypothetical protein
MHQNVGNYKKHLSDVLTEKMQRSFITYTECSNKAVIDLNTENSTPIA